ncbi:MAG: 30S ribosomal protein S6 [Candidatus Neomarinimicrobiota bacterium]
MKYYEAIFIAHPSLEDATLTKLVNETKEIFQKRGGEVIYEEEMGKKRLAYPIARQRFGNYHLLHFQSEALQNMQLNRDLEHKDDILAHMIVRIDKEQVLKPQPKPEVKSEADAEEGEVQKKVEEAIKSDEKSEDSTAETPATDEEAEPETAEAAKDGEEATTEEEPVEEESTEA